MITYQKELLVNILQECKQLHVDHYKEFETKDLPFDPDYDRYLQIEKIGSLLITTARKDGKIIGYVWMLITSDPHSKGSLGASDDNYYLLPKYRGSGIGVKLLNFTEQKLKELGVNQVFLHTRVEHDYSSLFKRLGFEKTEILFIKRI